MGETLGEAARETLDGEWGVRPLKKPLQQERSDTSEAFLTRRSRRDVDGKGLALAPPSGMGGPASVGVGLGDKELNSAIRMMPIGRMHDSIDSKSYTMR